MNENEIFLWVYKLLQCNVLDSNIFFDENKRKELFMNPLNFMRTNDNLK